MAVMPAYSQTQRSARWPVGMFAAIDFSSGLPVATSGLQNNVEASAAMSDSAGNLLFYTDGINVFDRMDSIMPNGGSIMGCQSSTQGALIVPMPRNPNRYYLFTTSCYEYNFSQGARYHVIDMSLNGGRGDLLLRDQLIVLDMAEELAATYHSNDCDVWITLHENNSAVFHAYLLTDTGLVMQPVLSTVGPNYYYINNTWGRTTHKFNAAGTMAVQCPRYNGSTQVHHFDRSTGQFSAWLSLNPHSAALDPYSACFSPNDSVLYMMGRNYSNNDVYSFLVQYDLSQGTSQAVSASVQMIVPRTTPPEIGQMQLGPDGKIYFSQYQYGLIGSISNPNTLGMGCTPNPAGIAITGGISMYSMPNFVSQFLAPGNAGSCTPLVALEAPQEQRATWAPHPVLSHSWLHFEPVAGAQHDLIITDVLGHTVLHQQAIQSPYRLDRQNLPAGTYAYLLTTNEAAHSRGVLIIQ